MKTIMYLLLIILMATSVSAILDTGSHPGTKQLCDMDGDGDIDSMDFALFDEIKHTMDLNDDGVSNLIDVSIFARNMRTPGWCFKTFGQEVEQEIISSNGLSFRSVKKYLFGDFLAYLGTIFVTHEDLARTQAKILLIEHSPNQDQIDCAVSMIMADKLNETYKYNGFVAVVGGRQCIKVNVV